MVAKDVFGYCLVHAHRAGDDSRADLRCARSELERCGTEPPFARAAFADAESPGNLGKVFAVKQRASPEQSLGSRLRQEIQTALSLQPRSTGETLESPTFDVRQLRSFIPAVRGCVRLSSGWPTAAGLVPRSTVYPRSVGQVADVHCRQLSVPTGQWECRFHGRCRWPRSRRKQSYLRQDRQNLIGRWHYGPRCRSLCILRQRG